MKTPGKQLATLVRVIFFYGCTLLVIMATSASTKSLPTPVADLSSVVAASLLTFALVYAFARWEQLRLRDVGVVPGKTSVQRFIGGYAIGLAMAAMQVGIVCAFGHLRLQYVPTMAASQILLSFLLYLFVACREELVFRSYPLRSLAYSFSPVVAMAIVVLIFIAEHLLAGMPWQMAVIGSGLGGLLFGLAALKTKGLALPLGLHSAWNFGQWIAGFKNDSGLWKAIVDKGYESETENIGLAAFALVTLLAIAGTVIFWRKTSSGSAKDRG